MKRLIAVLCFIRYNHNKKGWRSRRTGLLLCSSLEICEAFRFLGGSEKIGSTAQLFSLIVISVDLVFINVANSSWYLWQLYLVFSCVNIKLCILYRSSEGIPDCSCVIVGFTSGYMRIYLEVKLKWYFGCIEFVLILSLRYYHHYHYET